MNLEQTSVNMVKHTDPTAYVNHHKRDQSCHHYSGTQQYIFIFYGVGERNKVWLMASSFKTIKEPPSNFK